MDSSLAVDPADTAIARIAAPPDAVGLALLCSASRLICCDPDEIAICNLPHSRKSNPTLACALARNCCCAVPLAPERTASIAVPAVRSKFVIHPESIHGCGGMSNSKFPLCAASKMLGVVVARFTGAKYALIRRVTGCIAPRCEYRTVIRDSPQQS